MTPELVRGSRVISAESRGFFAVWGANSIPPAFQTSNARVGINRSGRYCIIVIVREIII
ncbi:MAG: hypothetical protein ACI83E_002658, partial [Sulfitobacter sp.]